MITEVAQNFIKIISTIPKSVQLVCVSKTKPIELIMSVYEQGGRHFGENYVEELLEKYPQLPKDIQWHFIGHLQSKKCQKLVCIPNLIIQTLDSEKLANVLQKELQKIEKNIEIYLQIKTSDEDSKYGIDIKNAITLFTFIHNNCPNLKIKGLMTIGKEGDLSAFSQLSSLKQEIDKKFQVYMELSMGMSADYMHAIQAGSTSIRVGSSIFGARNYVA